MKATVQPLPTGGGFVRIVEPYAHTYDTHVKARWVGKSLLDVYCDEFGAYSREYYEAAIQSGKILLSNKQVSPHCVLQNGQTILSHTIHLHEPAVLLDHPQIIIIAETDELVVVDKPATILVHPTGSSRYNSVLTMLEERLHQKLYTIHRLDRVTSGLCLFAKSPAAAQKWSNLESNKVRKYYLARVKGKFPLNFDPDNVTRLPAENNTITCGLHSAESVGPRKRNVLGYWTSHESLQMVFEAKQPMDLWLNNSGDDQWLHLACPTRVAAHKDGICRAGSFEDIPDDLYKKTVKASQTAFGVVSYCAETDSTVVVCKPTTGRSHQIRLHLQFLGHPIATDGAYGGDEWFANPDGRAACEEARLQLSCQEVEEATDASDDEATRRQTGEGLEDFVARTCASCRQENTTMLRFLSKSRGIWLRAIKYQMMDRLMERELMSYQAEPPVWAKM
jgi:tRNA pseudouridine synthase 9